MNTRGLKIEFIRMRSPSKAPPVFRFVGSTETIAIFLSLKSIRKRRTSSSTNEDFPAPPVPVIPRTGVLIFCFSISGAMKFLRMGSNSFSLFSAHEIIRAIA